MPDDDDAVPVHHDRLAETKLAKGSCDGINSSFIVTWVVLVRLNGVDRAHFDLHRRLLRITFSRASQQKKPREDRGPAWPSVSLAGFTGGVQSPTSPAD